MLFIFIRSTSKPMMTTFLLSSSHVQHVSRLLCISRQFSTQNTFYIIYIMYKPKNCSLGHSKASPKGNTLELTFQTTKRQRKKRNMKRRMKRTKTEDEENGKE